MVSHWNASSGGKGASARLRRSALLAFLLASSAGSHAAAPAAEAAAEKVAASAEVRLVAANAAAATAVFAIDGVLQSVKRGERVAATPLRLLHVGAQGVLIERVDADADRAARFQLAVGATLPAPPADTRPDQVPIRTSLVVQPRSVQSRQGADSDAPTQ